MTVYLLYSLKCTSELNKYKTTFMNMFSSVLRINKTFTIRNSRVLKGVLSDQTQLLATESPLKMMENPFYFTLKALLVLSLFKFWS